ATLLLAPVEHGEVRDPEPRPRLLVDQAEPLAEAQPERPEHPRGRGPRVGGEEERRPRLRAQRRELALREELRDRRAHLAVLADDEVGETLRSPLAREVLEPGELAPRELLRHAQEPHR